MNKADYQCKFDKRKHLNLSARYLFRNNIHTHTHIHTQNRGQVLFKGSFLLQDGLKATLCLTFQIVPTKS